MSENFNLDFSNINTGSDSVPQESSQPKTQPVPQQTDPNAINVQIAGDAPVVILWGPPFSGKSLAMIRLARFLKQGHKIVPIKNFRPGDEAYANLCANFDSFINNPVAPESTGIISFMLLQIEKQNRKICQILEAPGEHYFSPQNPQADLPVYLSTIIHSNTPKVYVFFLEIEWQQEHDRRKYAEKIRDFMGNIRSEDSVILLCNKCDKQPYIFNGKPEIRDYYREIRMLYPEIFERLRRKGLFAFLQSEYRKYDFVVFSSGEFKFRPSDNKYSFVQGGDIYPRMLWESILKSINGRWY